MADLLPFSHEVVLKITQKDFVDVLRDDNPCNLKAFDVKEIDDGDVLHLSVASVCKEHDGEMPKIEFKLVEKLPESDDEKASRMASEEASRMTSEEASRMASEEASRMASEEFKSLPDNTISLLVGKERVMAHIWKDSSPRPVQVLQKPTKDTLHSRHRGILESDLLQSKKVAVIGLGSGGSHVAIELAKAGVGHFVLIDYDRIDLSNVVRHICGIKDIGRFKTKAVRDQILDKNPFCEVVFHNTDITKPESKRNVANCDLLIAATDNTRSRLNINDIAFEFKIPALFGQCKTRAAAGDVVVVRPGIKTAPCYACINDKSSKDDEISSFRQARMRNPAYVSDKDVEATIQVGLSSDIIPISNMVVKIALVELCKGKETALTGLEKEFRRSLYVWSNRYDVNTNYLELKENGLEFKEELSILRWYADTTCKKNAECLVCNDTGENRADEQHINDYDDCQSTNEF